MDAEGTPDPAADPPAAAGRRPRLADVAARAGVSPGLVSLVLRNQPGPSEPTRARVLAAARELGYRADRTASLLARRRSRHLGVLLDVRNTFHAELVAHIDAAATNLGYDLVLSALTPARDERRAAELLLDFRCEALILLGPDHQVGWLAALGEEWPVIVVGRRMQSAAVDVVRAADDEGVAQAVGHLIGLGHRDIAFVDGGQGAIAADRRRGYRQSMRRLGPAARTRIIPGDHTEEAGMSGGPGSAGRRCPAHRRGHVQRPVRRRAPGRVRPRGRGRSRSGFGDRLRRQHAGRARPRGPDHGEPGRRPAGRVRGRAGRGTPGRRPHRPPRGGPHPAPGRPRHHRPAPPHPFS